MERALQIRVLAIEDSVLVQVEGEIDLTNAAKVKAALVDAAATAGATVEVDLSEVGYFGSEGLSALIEAYHHASAHSVDLRVTRASSPVIRVLTVTGLDHLFHVTEPDPEPS